MTSDPARDDERRREAFAAYMAMDDVPAPIDLAPLSDSTIDNMLRESKYTRDPAPGVMQS